MSSIKIKSGSEGPSYDPYYYFEIIIKRQSPDFTGTVTSHAGLTNWVRVDEAGKQPQIFRDADHAAWFEVYSGLTLRKAWRAAEEANARKIRYHPCGEKFLQEVDGMPGETMLQCTKCSAVLSTTFDKSAVE